MTAAALRLPDSSERPPRAAAKSRGCRWGTPARLAIPCAACGGERPAAHPSASVAPHLHGSGPLGSPILGAHPRRSTVRIARPSASPARPPARRLRLCPLVTPRSVHSCSLVAPRRVPGTQLGLMLLASGLQHRGGVTSGRPVSGAASSGRDDDHAQPATVASVALS